MGQLKSLGGMIYDEYMTTKAYHAALSDPASSLQPSAKDIEHILSHNILRQQEILAEASETQPAHASRRRNAPLDALEEPASILTGDQVLANGKLFMRDALEFVEFTSAMEDGNTGRLCKVMDVSTCAQIHRVDF